MPLPVEGLKGPRVICLTYRYRGLQVGCQVEKQCYDGCVNAAMHSESDSGGGGGAPPSW